MFEMYFFWKGRLFLKKGPSSQENLHVDLYSPSSLWCLRYPLLSKVTSEPSLSQISLAMHLNIHRSNYYILDLHPLDWEDWGRTKILIFIWIKPEVQSYGCSSTVPVVILISTRICFWVRTHSKPESEGGKQVRYLGFYNDSSCYTSPSGRRLASYDSNNTQQ